MRTEPPLFAMLPNGAVAALADIESSGLSAWASAARVRIEHEQEMAQIHREAADRARQNLERLNGQNA